LPSGAPSGQNLTNGKRGSARSFKKMYKKIGEYWEARSIYGYFTAQFLRAAKN
jgi:hypothetical protein